MNYWLVKSEPEAYSWADFLRDAGTAWTGVRNCQARNNLLAMQPGDLVLYYHSVSDKQVVGIARVAGAAAPDPTAEPNAGWVAPPLAPVAALPQPVPLAALKADARLQKLALLRQTRLSVVPVQPDEFAAVLDLGAWPTEKALN